MSGPYCVRCGGKVERGDHYCDRCFDEFKAELAKHPYFYMLF